MSKKEREIVLEWLYEKGFFTMPYIHVGNKTIDIMAFHPQKNEVWQVEFDIPFEGIGICGSKENKESLAECSKEYVRNKFLDKNFKKIKENLYVNRLEYHLVVDELKDAEEFEALSKNKVTVVFMKDIINDLKINKNRRM